MASNCRTKTPLHSQSSSLPLCLLLLLALSPSSAVTGSEPQTHYNGEVGGNVTLACPVTKNKNVRFMYLQKPISGPVDSFVNGFHANRSEDVLERWANTRLDRHNFAVLIFNLHVSYAGEYKCVIQYDEGEPDITYLHLNITAPYRNPMVTSSCGDRNGELGCNVTCAFHHGFPKNEIQWKKTNAEIVRFPKWIPDRINGDPVTKLFNISSTAYFHCSGGEQKVSCSVGNVISEPVSVCVREAKPVPTFVVALAIVLIVVVAVVCLIVKRRKLKQPADTPTANLEEGLGLTVRKETEAS